MSIIISGFRSDHTIPRTEALYLALRSRRKNVRKRYPYPRSSRNAESIGGSLGVALYVLSTRGERSLSTGAPDSAPTNSAVTGTGNTTTCPMRPDCSPVLANSPSSTRLRPERRSRHWGSGRIGRSGRRLRPGFRQVRTSLRTGAYCWRSGDERSSAPTVPHSRPGSCWPWLAPSCLTRWRGRRARTAPRGTHGGAPRRPPGLARGSATPRAGCIDASSDGYVPSIAIGFANGSISVIGLPNASFG